MENRKDSGTNEPQQPPAFEHQMASWFHHMPEIPPERAEEVVRQLRMHLGLPYQPACPAEIPVPETTSSYSSISKLNMETEGDMDDAAFAVLEAIHHRTN
jgi:hypothetical protein